jgi:K+-sensing histidine kinase KdpD
MGIPPEKLDHLFLNFCKIEENAEVNKNGVGLGLSICKNLIE